MQTDWNNYLSEKEENNNIDILIFVQWTNNLRLYTRICINSMMFHNFQVFFTRNGKIVGTKQVSIPKGGFFPTVGMLSSCEKVRVDLHPLTGWCPWSLAFFCFLFETSIHQCNDPTFVSPTHQTAKKRFTLPLYPRWMLLTYHSFKQENNPTYSNEIQILPPSCTFICYFLNVSTALTVLHMCAKTNTKLF